LQQVNEFILQLIKLIRPVDVVDIVLVAYIIFKGIKLIKDTRAEQLIKGIIILIIFTQLSEWLKLNTINFILKNTMQVGFIALVIVFQPELRRGLEQVGRSQFGKIFKLDSESEEDAVANTIEEVGKAVASLSENRIGALIVFERDTKIGDIIRTGIDLDSIVSAELLVNVFIPNTPLHDGAVIIRYNRITAAACFLPLTEEQVFNKKLGARHRAALGITENSDAVVVVVSEETGKISLALEGDLTRNLTVEILKKALYKTLAPDRKTNRKRDRLKNKILFWRGY
jgi:diadenylate cyclase